MNKAMYVTAFFLLTAVQSYGQSDHYDNAGKIYTVVAVVAITLIGIAAILFYLERRIKSIEEQISNE